MSMSSTLLPCGIACTCASETSSQCLLPYTMGPYPLICKFSPGYYPAARSVPAPRLVGIEPNPGPPKKIITKVVTLVQAKKKKRPRSRGSKMMSKAMPFAQPVNDYIKTLLDPFENPPMPLGYGTMTKTITGTGYFRNSLTVNSTDGNFSIIMNPSATNMIMVNTKLKGVGGDANWDKADCINKASLQAQNNASRVVSGGLRVMALLPTSVASGVLFAGSLPMQSTSANVTFSADSLSALGNAELGIGSNGAQVIMKPTGLTSYEFYPEILDGFAVTTGFPTSCLFISGKDFPVGTKIWYESILNLESFPKYGVTGVGVNTDSSPPDPGLTSYFPSLESAWNAISRVLGDSATMDAAAGAASALYPAASPAIHFARSAFGRGTHNRNVVGANVANQSRQSSIVIEEMKEEVGRPDSGWRYLNR